jgi:hypothetical protein
MTLSVHPQRWQSGSVGIIMTGSTVTAFSISESGYQKEEVIFLVRTPFDFIDAGKLLFRHLSEVLIADLHVDISSKLTYAFTNSIFSLRSLFRRFPKVTAL